ncbi:Segregation and condensation protein A [Phycisphaerales bacterium]|nr:Segregation and condensation protein A [Phycisphaerales bacterium]
MLTQDYKVRLDAFEGPLDLLLFLIKRSEVDIHNIPISTITEQYLSFLAQLREMGPARIDIDLAGEFLVMAATLMEIKSRLLSKPTASPSAAAGSDCPTADPRVELVRQLIEYKKYRDAGESLERRADDWRRRFPVARVGINDEALRAAIESSQDVELEDLDLIDLTEAFRRIAETVNFDRLGDHQVTYDDTPIEIHAEDILAQIGTRQEAGEVEFSTLFKGRRRTEMIGLFLALLELVRKRRVGVRQDRGDGSIYVAMRRESPGDAPEAAPTDAPAI